MSSIILTSNIISDIKNVFNALTTTDYLFFGTILLLIVILIILLFVFKNSDDNLEWEDEKNVNDLATIAQELKENNEQININLNNYELGEEEASVISYEELLQKNRNKSGEIAYEEEINEDDLVIKKVDIPTTTCEIPIIKDSNHNNDVLNYEKEEALLKALKELTKGLS